jgi:hypothetical protein
MRCTHQSLVPSILLKFARVRATLLCSQASEANFTKTNTGASLPQINAHTQPLVRLKEQLHNQFG